MSNKKIVLTGHNGYIGSVMGPMLVSAGYEVVGLDTCYFRECSLMPQKAEYRFIEKDIRDVAIQDLEDAYAVIHLAALSNDPIGNLNNSWTEEINLRGTIRLAELARAAGVRRFLFSSSCIMYGMSSLAEVDETCPVDPQTEYARSKVRGEQALSMLASKSFTPTYMRNGTIYGLSPRMRFDTVFNDFMASAVCTGKITVLSDGTPWRPVIHVEDVVRAFMTVLEAPVEKVHNIAFNTGANHLNYQMRELAETAAAAVPGCNVEVLGSPSADQRTYKCSFNRFAETFPDFKFRWDAKSSAKSMYEGLTALNCTTDVWKDRKFTRLKWLNHLMESGQLDGDLRWRSTVGEPAGEELVANA